MNQFEPELKRIRTDISCGQKIGPNTAMRLLDVLDQMAQEIDNLQRRVWDLQKKDVRFGPS